MGTRTQEYQVFQRNFDRLVGAVSSDVGSVASRCFSKSLISSNNMSAAQNQFHPEYNRASSLMSQILSKIDERKTNFNVFMSILQSIPTLRSLGNQLSQQVGGIQVPDSPPRPSPNVPPPSDVSTTSEPQPGTTPTGSAAEPSAIPSLSVKETLRMTISVAAEWQNIGTLLGLEDGNLAVIRANNPHQVTNCLREMLIVWLRQVNPRPSWSALAEAIEPFNSAKAREIREKCCL